MPLLRWYVEGTGGREVLDEALERVTDVLRMMLEVVVLSTGELDGDEEELEILELVNDVELVPALEGLELGEDDGVEVRLEVLLDITLNIVEVDGIEVSLLVERSTDDEWLEVDGKAELDETVSETEIEYTLELALLAGRVILLPGMLPLPVVAGCGGISECMDASEAN